MVLEPVTNASQRPRPTTTHFFAADRDVGGEATDPYDQALESLLHWVNKTLGSETLVSAKEEFYWKNGKVFPDDPFFHERMGYFTDFFVFQRVLDMNHRDFVGQTPFEVFRQESSAVENFPIQSVHHSIYQVLKSKDTELVIEDLLKVQKFSIGARKGESFKALQKKDIFQGFVYLGKERNQLSRGLVYHPSNGVRQIRKLVKNHLKSKEFDELKFLAGMARHQLKYSRHKNVDPKLIYENFVY